MALIGSRVYPFAAEEPVSSDFKMLVDGVEAPLHIARVSAFPINRRWPGHQRTQDQTELVSFASFEMDSPAKIELTPNKAFKEVVVRPLSKNIKPNVADGKISFTIHEAGAYTVELDGYHNALHIFADPAKKYDIDINDKNVIYYGKGLHDVGVIEMTEGQTLFIDEGAVVYARIHAIDANNIKILGRGILDVSKVKEVILNTEFTPEQIEQRNKGFAITNATRKHTIHLEYCDNVEIEGITIRDSLVYNIRPVCCRGLHIENVKIIGNWRYNSDGIDMHNCEDVVLRRCFIRTYDDSICIKGFDYTQNEADMFHNGIMYDVFKNVLIEKCVIWCDWGRSLEFGAETRAKEIFNITFRDCDLIRNSAVACDIQNVDYADIHDVLFENIRVEYDEVSQRPILQKTDDQPFGDDPESTYMPKLLGSFVTYVPEYSAGGIKRGINRDIVFKDIYVTALRMPQSAMRGYDEEHQSKDIVIDGIYFNGKRIETMEEANIEIGDFTSNISFK